MVLEPDLPVPQQVEQKPGPWANERGKWYESQKGDASGNPGFPAEDISGRP